MITKYTLMFHTTLILASIATFADHTGIAIAWLSVSIICALYDHKLRN